MEGTWPYLTKFMEPMLHANVNQTLQESKPAFLEKLELVTLSMGSKPPQILAVKGYNLKNAEEVVIDMSVRFDSDVKVILGG